MSAAAEALLVLARAELAIDTHQLLLEGGPELVALALELLGQLVASGSLLRADQDRLVPVVDCLRGWLRRLDSAESSIQAVEVDISNALDAIDNVAARAA